MTALAQFAADPVFAATSLVISGCHVSRLAGASQEPHLREAPSFWRSALTSGWD